MKIILGIILGLIVGTVLGFLLTLYTPIGNRFFIKTESGLLYKLDRWTGDTWMHRYYLEKDAEGKEIKIWHWDKIQDEASAIEQINEIRESIRIVEENERAEQAKIAQIKEAKLQKQKEEQEKIAVQEQAVQQKYKKIAKRCQHFEDCILRECGDDDYCITKVLYYNCDGDLLCVQKYCENKFEHYPDMRECTVRIMQ